MALLLSGPADRGLEKTGGNLCLDRASAIVLLGKELYRRGGSGVQGHEGTFSGAGLREPRYVV